MMASWAGLAVFHRYSLGQIDSRYIRERCQPGEHIRKLFSDRMAGALAIGWRSACFHSQSRG
jgi:hypothetical protein